MGDLWALKGLIEEGLYVFSCFIFIMHAVVSSVTGCKLQFEMSCASSL